MEKLLEESVVDIRNRIAFIGGFAKRLTDKKLKKPQYQDYARRIMKGVEESEIILNRLEKNKTIFLGTRVTTLDYKWRLVLPCDIAKQFNKRLLLKDGSNCLEIHRPSVLIFREDAPYASIQKIKIQRVKRDGSDQIKKVVMIPPYLRRSNSFYLGRKVILVGRGDYLEIWPHNDE